MRITIILTILIMLIFGCSKDENDNNLIDITGLGFFDNEIFDYVFFIEKINNVDNFLSENLVGLAVIKEDSRFVSVTITIDNIDYTMDNIAGGRLWGGPSFENLITDENATHIFNLNATGITLIDSIQQEFTYNKSFSLTNCFFTTETSFPDSLYTIVIDPLNSDTLYIAQDANITWQLAYNNEYQIIGVNESPFATPNDYEVELKPSDRSFTIPANIYAANPRKVDILLTQMNATTSNKFAAYTTSVIEKNYDDENRIKYKKPILEKVLEHIKYLK